MAAGTLGSEAATGGTSGAAGNVMAGEGAAAGGAPVVRVVGVVARGAGDRSVAWACTLRRHRRRERKTRDGQQQGRLG